MLRILSKNIILFSGYLLILISCLVILGYFGKAQTHILLTSIHSHILEELMKLLTLLGDGLFMVFFGILLSFKRLRYGLIFLSSFLASSLFVQFIKRLVFEDSMRPVAWFHAQGIEIYRIEGIEYYSSFSFPSGHTTTAFAMFFLIAFYVKNTGLKLFLLFLAVVTGFSRIYLSQHFMGDVLAGSVIGILTAIAMYSQFEQFKYVWLNENIISLIRKKNGKA